ncbi:translocation/assembly module TamB [Treponema primitia]|uniref:translocation/assembly module TamB domain-containing protein n=1 Tax=Treponema primitia TaxID=88058 RepID=UPI00397F7D71
MNTPVTTEADKHRNKSVYRLVRFGIELLIFLALVVVSTLLLRPLQLEIQARMNGLRNDLLSKAELFLDRRIEYASMGPSIFGSLDIRNIRIYAAGAEPVMTIDRFRLTYSFWDLVRGQIPGSIRSIRIDRPVITLDFKRDADLKDRFSSQTGTDSRKDTVRRISSLIPEDLLLRVRGAEFRVLTGVNTVHVEGLNFDTRAEAGRFLFSGKWSAQAELVGFLNQSFATAMSGRIDGELSRDLNNGSINLRIPTLSGDFFVFRTMTVNLTLTEKELEIRKINDRLPVDFSLNYAFDKRRMGISFRAEDFTPRDFLTFTGNWRKYNSYLNVRSTGFASISHSPDGDVSYEIDLSGSLQPNETVGPISYAVAGKGDEKYFGFTRCDFRLPQGELAYSGGLGLEPVAPSGIFHVKNFSFTGDGGINGDFAISSSGRTVNLFGEGISLGEVEFSVLDGDIVREDEGFSFSLSALRFRNIESYEDVKLSTLSLEGSYDRDPAHLQGSLALDSFAVSDMMDMIRPLRELASVPEIAKGITEDVLITTEVFVTTDFEHILYNAPRLVVAYSGKQNILTLVSVSGTDRRFELSEGQIVWAEGGAEAAGYADFSNPDDITFSFQTSYKDMFYFMDGEFLDRRSLSIHGSYGFQVYVSTTDYGGYSGYIEASSFPIPMDEQFARLSFLMSVRFDDSDYWSVTVDHFNVQDLITPVSAITSLGISGELNQDGLRFRRILFDDGRGPLTGRATASWGQNFSNPSGELIIRNQEEVEIARIDASYRGEAVDINFSGTNVQLARFLRNSRNTLLSGKVEIHWRSLDSYSANIDLSELSARIGDNDITLAGSAMIDQDTISLQEFRMHYNTLEGDFDQLRIDRRNAHATAAARIGGIFMGRNMDMVFNTELNFAPINSWFNLPKAMESFEGALFVQNVHLDAIRSRQPFNFIFSRNHTQLSLSGGPGDMLRLQVSDRGAFYAAFSSPAPFRGSVVGTITGNTIDAQTSNLYVDMASLWRFIPGKEVINVPGGFAEASVEIRGSLGDPEFFGTIRANSLRLQVPQFIREDIEPVPTTITLEGNEMSFGPIPARVGSGSGMASGWFRFDRWVPSIFTLDIRVPDETAIPFGVDIAGIQADGDVSGHLVLSMEEMIFKVSGDLTGNNAEINLDTQQISALSMETAEGTMPVSRTSVVTDLRIITGSKVEFVYPSREFPVIRANTGAGTGIRITTDTGSGRFTVEGDVAVRSGEIFYFQRSFYIQEGILSFNESDIQFDPQISARAEARDRTDEGAVTISMIVDSSPLRSFIPRFESNPPLSQFEIFSLLGQNVTGASSEDSSDSIRSMVLASGDFLAQFYLVRRLERAVRDVLGMDMFSVRTQILQNAIFQATGLQEPVDRISSVGNYFDNTTVFLGKYFGPDVFGQAMLSFRYDENRTSFGDFSRDGFNLGAGVSLEADIGLEIRGPLFDIQFNVAPRHMDPRIVEDFSLTLSWKRSIRNLSDLWKEP